MTLHELLREALGMVQLPFSNVRVRGVAQDARRVEPGFVFIARSGMRFDGHDFIPEALKRGAVAVVGARGDVADLAVPYIHVSDDRLATSALAASFFGNPSHHLWVAGVTGTDGKTTTAAMLHHLLQGDDAVVRAALLSTALERLGREGGPATAGFTTPEATEVHAFLARARAAGATAAVVEASSHASFLKRLAHVRFRSMAWTSLTPEHLDLHGSFERYREAKLELVRNAEAAVLHRDDPQFPYFSRAARGRTLTVGEGDSADVRAEKVVGTGAGFEFQLRTPDGRFDARVPMLGRFNLINSLCALASAYLAGTPWAQGIERLATFAGVPGRMQLVAQTPVTVVVDFAHTPDALQKVLTTLRQGRRGQLWVVVGAPGERDSTKRPELGAIAVKHADMSILTEDDTRSESLDGILAQMVAGAEEAGGKRGVDFLVMADRRAAIEHAILRANPGDTVLLAGKGHEQTLYRSSGSIPWSDARVAAAALAMREDA